MMPEPPSDRDIWRHTWLGPSAGRLAARLRLFRRAWFREWLVYARCPYTDPEAVWGCVRAREHPGPHQLTRRSREDHPDG